MDIGKITENPAVTGSDGGRSIANIIYILYIIGFFTGITALIGVILAYVNKDKARSPYREHLESQIRLFWLGIVCGGVLFMSSWIIGIVGAFTWGIGFVLYIFPLGLGIWWLVKTVMGIIKGMQALGNHQSV